MEPSIIHYIVNSKKEFGIELTQKTVSDVKGGVLYQKMNENVHLLEIAQVPTEHINDFQDINVFKYFNTNSMWVNLLALSQKKLELDLILNPKTVENKKIIQLEVAAGAAVSSFDTAALVVPRSRFLPVKKPGIYCY